MLIEELESWSRSKTRLVGFFVDYFSEEINLVR